VAAASAPDDLAQVGPDLKGPEFSVTNTSEPDPPRRHRHSVRVDKGAYHMVSDVPVTAWQFNPIEYSKPCHANANRADCRSASTMLRCFFHRCHDAELSRVHLSSRQDGSAATSFSSLPSGRGHHREADGTSVAMQFSKECGAETNTLRRWIACRGDRESPPRQRRDLRLRHERGRRHRADRQWGANFEDSERDLSGSVIQATKPVQVIAFNAIANLPDSTVANADHLEETVLPAEVIGKKYIVVPHRRRMAAP